MSKLRGWETARQTGGLSAEATSWPGLRGNSGGNSFPSVAPGQALAPRTALGAPGRAGFGRDQFREEQGGKTGAALRCFCLISSLSGYEDARQGSSGKHGGTSSARSFGVLALTQSGLERMERPLLLKRGEMGRAAKGYKFKLVPRGISSLAFPGGEGNNWLLLHLHWGVSALMDDSGQ